MWGLGVPVLFFVNINAPSDRMRLTLCHELGHMILHTATILDDSVMEEEADRFAGAFLLPAREVRPQLRQFNLRQLSNMKRYWKVSMAAIATRADQLGLITQYQKKSFWVEMSRLGYRKREPNEPQKERPKLISKMISYHIDVLKYSRSELAKILYLSLSEFDRMYGDHLLWQGDDDPSGGRTHLRVIK